MSLKREHDEAFGGAHRPSFKEQPEIKSGICFVGSGGTTKKYLDVNVGWYEPSDGCEI